MRPRASSAAARAMAATSAWTCTVAPSIVRVPVCTGSACQAPLGQTGPVRDVVLPGPAHREAAWKAVRHFLAVTPVVGVPQLGPSGLGQGRDGPAHRVLQGARRPRRGVGHAGAGPRPRRRGVLGRQPRARPGLRGVQARRPRHRRRPDGRLGGQGVGAPAVRRAPRPPRRGVPRGRDARPRTGRPRREPLRVALQRPRRHRGPGERGPRAGRAGARPRHRGRALRGRRAAGRRHLGARGDGRARRRDRVRGLSVHEHRPGRGRHRPHRGRADRGRRAGGQPRARCGHRRRRPGARRRGPHRERGRHPLRHGVLGLQDGPRPGGRRRRRRRRAAGGRGRPPTRAGGRPWCC